MYLLRGFRKIKSLIKANNLNDLSATFLDELNTSDGDYSFFEIENNDSTSDEVMMIVVSFISGGFEKWSANVSSLICPKDVIENIKPLSEPSKKEWGGVHYNFPKASVSNVVEIIKVFFEYKTSIKTYTFAEIYKFMWDLDVDTWKKIFSGKNNEPIIETIEKIKCKYFRNGAPEALSKFEESLA
ncbi:MAG: hypothetical protein K6E21_02070 [Bacilli bacterium]|nr:hypothetical protein [Bacilli bacterium]